MRTLQIINSVYWNATAWYAINLAATLNKNGHKSIVVGLADSLPLIEAKKLGLETYELPLNSISLKDFKICSQGIDHICKEFQPDIVNCHRGEMFFLWVLKKKKYGYKLVRTRGDQRLPANNFINKILHATYSDAVISTNSEMTSYFRNALRVPKEKAFTILGGVDTDAFYPSCEDRKKMREQYNFTENDIVIAVIGRLDPVKGHLQALQAFANLLKNPEYTQRFSDENAKKLHLVLIGLDCTYTMDYFQNTARDLDVPEDSVHYIGAVESMQKTMNMLDVGLVASLSSETIARVAFEMIACHVPLISSRIGVMPDILDEDFLYNSKDLEHLEHLYLDILNENYRKKSLDICLARLTPSLAGHIKNEQDYMYSKEFTYGWTLQAFYEKTLNVYEKICVLK